MYVLLGPPYAWRILEARKIIFIYYLKRVWGCINANDHTDDGPGVLEFCQKLNILLKGQVR